MKYERLTNRGEPFYGFEKCRTCEYGKDGCDNWCDKITGCFCRLQELEDKIESGELCDRKETAREILNDFMINISDYALIVDCEGFSNYMKNLVKKYYIEQVGNSDKLEDEE